MLKSVAVLLIGILIVDSIVITALFIQQNGKLKTIEDNAVALESQINQQNGEMASLRGNISNLQSQFSASEANASALQTALTTAQTHVTQLQQQLMNAKQVINQAPAAQLQPAAFNVDNITVTPGTLKAGNTVTVVVGISNTGGQAGTYQVDLQIREYSKQIYDDKGQSITLAAGKSGNATFSFPIFDTGNYVLSVENVLKELIVN